MPPSQPPPQAGRAEQESQAGADALACPTAKLESSFRRLEPPHLAQTSLPASRPFCNTSITCPHCSHLYSKIGILDILIPS
jgi:hypothetical protein